MIFALTGSSLRNVWRDSFFPFFKLKNKRQKFGKMDLPLSLIWSNQFLFLYFVHLSSFRNPQRKSFLIQKEKDLPKTMLPFRPHVHLIFPFLPLFPNSSSFSCRHVYWFFLSKEYNSLQYQWHTDWSHSERVIREHWKDDCSWRLF